MIILHYIPSIEETSGGVGAYMQLLTRDLGKLCDLHVITHKGDNERELENCIVHYIPYKWLPWNNCKKDFESLLEELHPDVVHVNCCWQPVPSMLAQWGKAAGYKVVYTPHGMLEPYALQRHYWTKKLPAILMFQKKGIKVADLVHATAYTEKDNLIKLGWNKNVEVVANCVKLDEIQMKTSWERSKNILFLSRVHPKKGINFLIEAVAQLKQELAGYTITVAGPGDGAYVKELKKMAHKLGVYDKLSFVGPVYSNDKWPLYRRSDLFVLPTYSENFGIVIPEALASGTPVITTVGTPWKELNDCNCGWCIEIGTEPLVQAIRKFLSKSDEQLIQMGHNCRKLVEDKYASEAIAKQFVEMYHKITNSKK